jgi:hypothetical protein
MNQSNALSRLKTILDKAVECEDPSKFSGSVLLQAMNLPPTPQNIVEFYELLGKAYEETKSLKDISGFSDSLVSGSLEILQQLVIKYNLWETRWSAFHSHLTTTNSQLILGLLANEVSRVNPKVILEKVFLQQLHDEFSSLLEQIHESNLSQKIKQLLIIQIDSILKSIRRYNVEGTEGIEQTAKLRMLDLALAANKVTKEEKNHPLFKKVYSSVVTLGSICGFTMSFVGFVPDVEQYWIPKFQNFLNGRNEIEKIINEKSSIEAIFEDALEVFKQEETKAITGRNLPALPPCEKNVETNVEGNINP